ncbi:MAG TPA: hypothetical protein ENJ88_05130 [Phaeodactylibacter sp.]|nr:hypothetical protein [Phaeodactylibacter sp.]
MIRAFLFLLCVVLLGYLPEQGDFALIAVLYGSAFLLYFWVVLEVERGALSGGQLLGQQRAFRFDLVPWMWVAVLARFALLWAMPNLSDDVYRFIWDGRLGAQGLDVFAHLPAWYMEEGHEVRGLTRELFEQLNSPEYFTIYPPVAQAVFRLGAWLFPESIYGSVLVLRIFLLLCELGSLYLLSLILRRLQLPKERVLLYALNPLVIVEISGNLHFEGAMVFFFLLFVWAWLEARRGLAALAMSLSIGAKLLPLMLLPLLATRMWEASFWLRPQGPEAENEMAGGRAFRWRAVLWFLVLGFFLLLLFYPFMGPFFAQHFGESLDLYFRRFEFNASVYYLLRWLRYLQLGYNDIHRLGPLLGLVVAAGILGMALWSLRRRFLTMEEGVLFFLRQSLWAFVLYLGLATIVHPWYLAMPVLLAVFGGWRFPLWWSYAITWTYINYSYPVYRENLWVVGLEYSSVLLFMLWEWQRQKKEAKAGAPAPDKHLKP